MRLFVAAVPPADVLDGLASAVAAARCAAPDLRWVPPERWHVTLCFLGEVADDRVHRVSDGLTRELAERPAPQVRLAGGGSFGGRVLWVGLAGEVDLLGRAARATARAARAAGVRVERQPFRAHLTVTRVRGSSPELAAATAALAACTSRDWTVAEAVLVRSRLGPHPTYEPLSRHPLRPA